MKKCVYILLGLVFSISALAQEIALSPAAFQEAIKQEANLQLIDLRSASQYSRGHLKKAVNLDYATDNFEENLLKSFDTKRPLYIYCYSGMRSQEAKAYLPELGFKTIYWLQGGFADWTSQSKPYVSNSTDYSPIAAFTEADFNRTVQDKNLVLVDFFATWCGPCKKMNPVLATLQQTMPHLTLLKVDAELNDHLAKRFDIAEIPTYLIFKNGQQIWRGSGFKTENELRNLLR